jgi:antitoxin MazE
MKANIIQIGNSKGVRIPKSLLDELKFEKLVEFEILPNGLLLRPIHEKPVSPPRAGWSEMFKSALDESGDDREKFGDWNQTGLTEFDEKEW